MSRSSFIVFLCGIILWALVSQVNHYLAPFNLSLFVAGLFVTFPALRLPYREGSWALVLLGLFLDTPAPVPFGLQASLFLLAQAILFNIRHRLAREETLVAIAVALLTNLGIFLALTLSLSTRGPVSRELGLTLVINLVASQLAIIFLGPWYIALQERALTLCGISLRREQAGLL